jgi:uncharacterized damage-inducible protein DinB
MADNPGRLEVFSSCLVHSEARKHWRSGLPLAMLPTQARAWAVFCCGSESACCWEYRRTQRQARMIESLDLAPPLLAAWRTNSRVTSFLVEQLPAAVWDVPIPGEPRRTVRMIAGHLHNARCTWIKRLGHEHGITAPPFIDRRKVTRRELRSALNRSSKGIEALLELGIAAGGHVPPSKAYVWRNLPLDVAHVLTYFVAHEAHHRGQIVMVARQLGHRLPNNISGGLWQWTTRLRELRRGPD